MLSAEELAGVALPTDEPWAQDLFFVGIERFVSGHRFLVGGDWNNSRLFDQDRKPGQLPVATMFFTRAKHAGWVDCHGHKNEERSYLGGKRPHQLDHLFCDTKTARRLVDSHVRLDWLTPELSDHAPLVTDLEWERPSV